MTARPVPGPVRAALLFSAALVAGWPSAAPAAASGHEGACTDDSGVTVVVDLQDLGGEVTVRCAPDFPDGGTGLDALQLAGFTPSGTVRDGAGFVCRIDDRPSADEVIVAGGREHRESCTVTPPDWAHWGYWHAADGGEWTHSSSGATRAVTPGGHEGWSFAVDRAVGEALPPRFDPSGDRPGTPGAAPADAPGSPAADAAGPGAATLVPLVGLAALAGAGVVVWRRRRGPAR